MAAVSVRSRASELFRPATSAASERTLSEVRMSFFMPVVVAPALDTLSRGPLLGVRRHANGVDRDRGQRVRANAVPQVFVRERAGSGCVSVALALASGQIATNTRLIEKIIRSEACLGLPAAGVPSCSRPECG